MNQLWRKTCIAGPRMALVVLTAGAWISVVFVSAVAAQSQSEPPTSAPASQGTGGPRAVIAEATKDFGEFWAGAELTHNFVIKNPGDQVLQLLSVKASCGCTSTGYDKEIAPGAEGKVSAKLNTKNFPGRFSKSITVTTNDPTQQTIHLTLSGTAKQYVSVEPRNAAFTQVQPDEILKRTVRITNNGTEPMKLDLEADRAGPFTAVLKEVEPGKSYDLEITGQPPYQPKLNRGTFNLTTNVAAQAKIEVPCSAYVPPRLELRPDSLRLRPVMREETRETLRFVNNGKTGVKVTGAEVDDPKVTAAVREDNPGKEYAIELVFPKDYSAPDDGAKLLVKTDDLEMPALTVPITQMVPPKPLPKPGDNLVGQPAPKITLTTVEGQSLAVGEPRDEALLLTFYASSSPFAKRVLPEVEKIHQKFKDRGVRVVAINQNGRTGKTAQTAGQITESFTSLGLTMERALDPDREAGRPYPVQASFPTLYLIGRNGVVEATYLGTQPDLLDAVSKDLDLLLAGQSPSAAKRSAATRAEPPAGPLVK
jgi:thiol-disulfide isomerase/thioredoxin